MEVIPRRLMLSVSACGSRGLTLGGGGGFGQTNQASTAFGARPGFGSSGASFGASTTPATGGGLFGAPASTPAFGAANNTTGGGLFGQQSGGGFGSTPASTFGSASVGAGVQHGQPSNEIHNYPTGPPPPLPGTGTQAPLYQPTWQRDPATSSMAANAPPPHLFHAITAMEAYRGGSNEELRLMDYMQNRKEPTAQQPAAGASTGFGQTAASTGFGSTSVFGQQPATTTPAFGAPKPAGGLFGSTSTGTSGFGSTPAAGGFGSTTTGGGLFGQQSNTTNTFGQQNNTGGGLFGSNTNQQQPAASGGLFGSSTNAFGQNNQTQQPASTGFGFGAAKPAFGATAPATGFGSTPAAGTSTGFGQTNTTNPSPFGGFGAQNTTQPQQTGGLFGGGSTGFGQTNTQQTNAFGQNNSQQGQQQTGGLFGSTAPKPAGGLFGSTPAAPATTGFGGFGATNTTQPAPATGGLFGQNNTTTASSTPFGQQQNTQQQTGGGLFGSTASTGGGLFGQNKPAAPATGGLFGQTNNTQPAQTGAGGFGGFGSTLGGATQQQSGGGLFGNTNNNQANAPKPLFSGGGSSLFGQQQQQQPAAQTGTTGGLFGGLNQSQNNASTGGLFGSTAQPQQQSTFGQSGGLFGSTLGQTNNNNNQQQQSLSASVDQNPYGRSDLFTYSGQKLELGSTNKKPALPPLTVSSYRITPTKGRLTQLRGFASSVNLAQSANGRASPSAASPSRSVLGSPAPSDRYKGLTDAALSPNAFIPRPSVKKINVAAPKPTLGGDDRLESVLGKSALRSSANGSAPGTPTLSATTRSPTLAASTSRTTEDTPTRSKTPAETSMRVAVSERPLKRGDYWCRPKLEKLRMMSHDELRRLEHFSAGRKGFGSVEFLEPVDLTGLSSLSDLLGDIITVEELELTVYPDDSNKPPMGKGLNVPAEISLENVFARDKATRQPITDPKDPRYQRKLKRIQAVPDTEFISLDEHGVWTFRVEHFTTYGLDDSDEEMEDASSSPPRKSRSDDLSSSSFISEDEDDDFLPTKGLHDADATSTETSLEEEDEDSYDESVDLSEEFDVSSADMSADWDKPIKAKLGSQGMQRLREMQSSFFAQDNKAKRAIDSQRAAVDRAAELLERKRFEAGFGDAEEEDAKLDVRAVERASFGEPSSPPRFRRPRKYAKVALADSFVKGNEGVRPDAGLALGRSFRCSWGPNGELVHFGKICAPGDKL